MKKSLLLIPLLLLGSVTFASDDISSFPAFPMTIYGNIKIWSSNLNWWTLKVYNSSNKELASYNITQNGKYWSDNVSIEPLLLNKFDWSLTFKVFYNGKTYIVNSIDDSNKLSGCPSKSSITFVSENCRYDISLKEESSSSGSSWWGSSSSSSSWWWGKSSSSSSDKSNNSNTEKTVSNTKKEESNTKETKNLNLNINQNTNGDQNTKSNQNTNVSVVNNLERKQLTKPSISKWDPKEILQNGYTREQNDAYSFARNNWITTMNNIKAANLNSYVTRAAMAKMLSYYAINYLGRQPDTSRTPYFADISTDIDNQYDNWITLAYQLWLMGVWSKNFRPYAPVTRAEFWTALSRLLYGTRDWNDKYYTTHLAKLKQEWIISNDTPNLKEKRWNILIMLMRSATK